MENTALIIMAAGIGSRFGGGIKQLSPMVKHSDGSRGEIIIDYSIYDAIDAGFNKIIIIIRKSIEEDFREVIGNRIDRYLAQKGIEVCYAFQELEDIPAGYAIPDSRVKPWGTGHAILCCRDLIQEPFCIINADDYYGKQAFVQIHDWLLQNRDYDAQGRLQMAMAGFILKNTVSENGTVTRGVCQTDAQHMLTGVIETKAIAIREGKAVCDNPMVQAFLTPEARVSMNMWAGYPAFLRFLEEGFMRFLDGEGGDPASREFLIPVLVDTLLRENRVTVQMLETTDKWIGITYKADLKPARTDFSAMLEAGIYPEKLWS